MRGQYFVILERYGYVCNGSGCGCMEVDAQNAEALEICCVSVGNLTLAKEQAYNDMSDKQIVKDTLKYKNRQTLARHYMCPLEVYKIMLECWAHNSKQ